MADVIGVLYDPDQPPGERLAPEVRAEINLVAPSTVNDGDITTPKLRDGAVTGEKIEQATVTGDHLAPGAVGNTALANGAVTGGKVADHTLTDTQAGAGIATAHSATGQPIRLTLVPMTAVEYSAVTNPDPDTAYLIYRP